MRRGTASSQPSEGQGGAWSGWRRGAAARRAARGKPVEGRHNAGNSCPSEGWGDVWSSGRRGRAARGTPGGPPSEERRGAGGRWRKGFGCGSCRLRTGLFGGWGWHVSPARCRMTVGVNTDTGDKYQFRLGHRAIFFCSCSSIHDEMQMKKITILQLGLEVAVQ